MVKITLSPDGAGIREVDIEDIRIPDLWHLGMWLKDHEAKVAAAVGHNHLAGQKWSDAVLETWQLAHDLLKNIQRPELVKRE